MSRFVSGEGGCGATERVLRLRGGRAARIAGPPHTTTVRRCLRCRAGIYATEVQAATVPLRATARAFMSSVLDMSGVVRRAKMVGRPHAMCARRCQLYLTCLGLCGAVGEDGRVFACDVRAAMSAVLDMSGGCAERAEKMAGRSHTTAVLRRCGANAGAEPCAGRIQRMMTALTSRTPERRLISSLSASRW